MREIYLIGGGNYTNNSLDNINHQILNSFDKAKTFLIVPFATSNDKRKKWIESIKSSFSRLRQIKFEVLSETDSKNEKIKKIMNSDLLFFTGGSPEKLILKMQKNNLIPLIKSYKGILVGFSAGALALSDLCFICKDEDYPLSMIIRGMGIVNFMTSVHYNEKEKEEISIFSRYSKIYAIPDNSALIIKNNQISFFGKINIFE